MKDFKVKLIYIPQYRCKVLVKFLPYGVGVLSAFLKSHDYQVVSEDIGTKIDSYNEKSWFSSIDSSIVRHEKEILDYVTGRTQNKKIQKFTRQVSQISDLKNYDLIGISVKAYLQFLFALVLAKQIKATSRAKVVLGGPFITLNGKNFFQDFSDIDYMVSGDGQVPLLKLIQYLEGKIPIEDVPSLLYRQNGTMKENPRQFFPVEDICLPDFSDLPLDAYLSIFGDKPVLSYQTSRGCTFGCNFCNRTALNPSIEFKSYEKIAREIREMKECYHSDMFWFHDDCINASYEYLDKLCDLLIQENLNINWVASARADNLDRKILRKMRKAGCRFISFGIESVSSRILKDMRKMLNIQQATRILRESYEEGILNNIDFIVGNPFETKEDVLAAVKFIRDNAKYIETIIVSILRIEYGSPLQSHPEQFGIENLRPIFDSSRELDFYHFAFDEIGGLKWEQKIKEQRRFETMVLKARFELLSKNFHVAFIPFTLYFYLTEKFYLLHETWFIKLLKKFLPYLRKTHRNLPF